jgi:hypothetical protein
MAFFAIGRADVSCGYFSSSSFTAEVRTSEFVMRNALVAIALSMSIDGLMGSFAGPLPSLRLRLALRGVAPGCVPDGAWHGSEKSCMFLSFYELW